MGALCYLAAWDVRQAKIFDRCEAKDGIAPFDRLVEQLMTAHPYANAQRVFLVIDNGSAHRGKRSIDRLQGAWPNLTVVHTPIHASWLNQCEIYFSIVQRKALQPNDFADLDTLEQTLLGVRAPLPTDRQALRMEVHPPRPRPATHAARRPRQDRPRPRRLTPNSVNAPQRQETFDPANTTKASAPRTCETNH